MKIFSYTTNAYKKMHDDCFKPSADKLNLKTFNFHDDVEGDIKFGTDLFKNAIKRKMDLIIDTIKENIGEVILWSDVDIVILRDFREDIEKTLGDKDIAISPEAPIFNEVINSGFMGIRCSEKTANYFGMIKHVCCKQNKTEQPIINKTIDKLNYVILSNKYWNTTFARHNIMFDDPFIIHCNFHPRKLKYKYLKRFLFKAYL